ncbi:MAG: GGDEF domain-containing protein [Anaeromyxobacter sp.]|nr:GGDEF domain-containing protein [Anaeromyxobacter sp.]MBL0278252.1 GGDEF domain-containing protein [Anaeromyxobacter sp.]
MRSSPALRRSPPPRRAFLVALALPGLAAGAALAAGHAAGTIAVSEAAGFLPTVPPGLPGLLGALAAGLLVAQGVVLHRLRRRVETAHLQAAALSITDELTGAGTRRFVLERLADELGRARRYGRALSLALVDLDGIARINQAVGSDGGDAVLRAMAGAVRARLRRSDAVGRLRDDELLVLLPETDAVGAQVIAERLRAAVASLQVLHAGITLQATCSVGVAAYAPAEEREPPEAEALLRRADEALFRAKADGRNRVA